MFSKKVNILSIEECGASEHVVMYDFMGTKFKETISDRQAKERGLSLRDPKLSEEFYFVCSKSEYHLFQEAISIVDYYVSSQGRYSFDRSPLIDDYCRGVVTVDNSYHCMKFKNGLYGANYTNYEKHFTKEPEKINQLCYENLRIRFPRWVSYTSLTKQK